MSYKYMFKRMKELYPGHESTRDPQLLMWKKVGGIQFIDIIGSSGWSWCWCSELRKLSGCRFYRSLRYGRQKYLANCLESKVDSLALSHDGRALHKVSQSRVEQEAEELAKTPHGPELLQIVGEVYMRVANKESCLPDFNWLFVERHRRLRSHSQAVQALERHLKSLSPKTAKMMVARTQELFDQFIWSYEVYEVHARVLGCAHYYVFPPGMPNRDWHQRRKLQNLGKVYLEVAARTQSVKCNEERHSNVQKSVPYT